MRISLHDINRVLAPDTKTEENCLAPGHEEWQEQITIGDKTFWADPELIPLLKALNEAGLITRAHCQGHEGDNPSWIAIKLDNVQEVYIRRDNIYNEIRIEWDRNKEKTNDKN